MPIQLSVSEVRKEIYRKAGGLKNDIDVTASTLLLGRMFHESFARMFGDDKRFSWRSVIAHADLDEEEWERLIEEHLYQRIIGPILGRERVHLKDATLQVVAFWQAAKAMNCWVVNLLWTARKGEKSGKRPAINLLVSPEEPLSMRIQEAHWTDSVVLTGIADLVLRIPGKDTWCIVELKLGKGCPEADLAQACLYHQILSSSERSASSAMALIAFRPEKEERLFEAANLHAAQKRLKSLIGSMAGVIPGKANEKAPCVKASTNELSSQQDREKYHLQAGQLVSIFQEYGKEITIAGDPVPVPTFIRFPIMLGKGVKLHAAHAVAQEIQHRLHLESPPYVHLSEGSVVIDLQRPDRKVVQFLQIRDQLPKTEMKTGCSMVLLGVDLNNKLRFADLSEPDNVHILVAGTTGSGKSEWLRSALAGLILTNSPDTLRFVLIDPKRNAFNEFKGSPFLLSSDALVYPDEQSAATDCSSG